MIEFRIKGSAPEPYLVTFEKLEGKLSVACNCVAGAMGQHCKHRIALLGGDFKAVVSGHEYVGMVREMAKGTEVERALELVHQKETQLAIAQKELANAKKVLASAMA